ncbi:hypothetical protein [Sulfurimonas autotrophica]|uniref:Uncharacterized protein n=1 Tax=Sulfurimonas autotrophica (strain ATCC BAA-671 / DSM 16294 / JCM 11897 / OK10) TaxID=563040 RepID=E0UTF2_SULAO|nr:hypothetical protein [Sulfurimonas autotrophica]ADN09317.1 hypothetical protein Saut_1269 [Sulfurimonas autotrophica DSM 16294]
MKFLLVLIFVLNLYADEIQRIDSIVEDITKLRMNYQKSQKEINIYKNRVKTLENELKIANNLLKAKENNIVKIKVKEVKCLNNQENVFPKLKMRTKIIHTNASAYRLNKNAPIYNDINGMKIDEWEKGTSFTSNQKTDKFIKITGYFKNRQWVKAEKPLWIDINDAFKRDVK